MGKPTVRENFSGIARADLSCALSGRRWQHPGRKVAIHFDVDTIDANEIQLGLGADIGGLTSAEARRVVADIDAHADVVALTIAEYIPRQVMHLQQLLAGFPLL